MPAMRARGKKFGMDAYRTLGEQMIAIRRNGLLTAANAKPLMDEAERQLALEREVRDVRRRITQLACMAHLYDGQELLTRFWALRTMEVWEGEGSGI